MAPPVQTAPPLARSWVTPWREGLPLQQREAVEESGLAGKSRSAKRGATVLVRKRVKTD